MGFALFILGALTLSCMATLMAVFIGSESSDLPGLLNAQLWAVLPGVLAAAVGWTWLNRLTGGRETATVAWHLTNGGLVFAYVIVNTLALFGEMAIFVMQAAGAPERGILSHAPLLCAIACSTGFVLLNAARLMSEEKPNLDKLLAQPLVKRNSQERGRAPDE